MPEEELMTFAKELGAPYELVKETRELGRLPVVNFAAGGIATPADAALMLSLIHISTHDVYLHFWAVRFP